MGRINQTWAYDQKYVRKYGKLYASYAAGATTIEVQYTTTDSQKNYVQCQVGGRITGLVFAGVVEQDVQEFVYYQGLDLGLLLLERRDGLLEPTALILHRVQPPHRILGLIMVPL